MNFINNIFKQKPSEKIEGFNIDFLPKEDITPIELAQCVKFYVFVLTHPRFPSKTYQFVFNGYPENVKRHFETKVK